MKTADQRMDKKPLEKIITSFFASRLSPLLFTEIIIGTLLSIFSLIIFLQITWNVNHYFYGFDTSAFKFFLPMQAPSLSFFMVVVSIFGNEFILFASVVIILFLLWKSHRWEATLFLIMLGMGTVINLVLKLYIARLRPDIAPLILESYYSFPSGHAMNAFVFYITIAFFIFRFTRKKAVSAGISILSIILILLIGISRVYLGVHYASDVIAGYIAGFWWFVTALVLEKTFLYYRVRKRFFGK